MAQHSIPAAPIRSNSLSSPLSTPLYIFFQTLLPHSSHHPVSTSHLNQSTLGENPLIPLSRSLIHPVIWLSLQPAQSGIGGITRQFGTVHTCLCSSAGVCTCLCLTTFAPITFIFGISLGCNVNTFSTIYCTLKGEINFMKTANVIRSLMWKREKKKTSHRSLVKGNNGKESPFQDGTTSCSSTQLMQKFLPSHFITCHPN